MCVCYREQYCVCTQFILLCFVPTLSIWIMLHSYTGPRSLSYNQCIVNVSLSVLLMWPVKTCSGDTVLKCRERVLNLSWKFKSCVSLINIHCFQVKRNLQYIKKKRKILINFPLNLKTSSLVRNQKSPLNVILLYRRSCKMIHNINIQIYNCKINRLFCHGAQKVNKKSFILRAIRCTCVFCSK